MKNRSAIAPQHRLWGYNSRVARVSLASAEREALKPFQKCFFFFQRSFLFSPSLPPFEASLPAILIGGGGGRRALTWSEAVSADA